MFTRSCQQDRERLTIIVVQQVHACVVTCAYIYCTDCHMTSHMVKWLQNLPQSLSLAFKLTVNQMHKHTGLNLTTCTCTCIRQLHTTIHHNYHFTSRHMTSHKWHMTSHKWHITSHNCHMTSHNCHMTSKVSHDLTQVSHNFTQLSHVTAYLKLQWSVALVVHCDADVSIVRIRYSKHDNAQHLHVL